MPYRDQEPIEIRRTTPEAAREFMRELEKRITAFRMRWYRTGVLGGTSMRCLKELRWDGHGLKVHSKDGGVCLAANADLDLARQISLALPALERELQRKLDHIMPPESVPKTDQPKSCRHRGSCWSCWGRYILPVGLPVGIAIYLVLSVALCK
jgi:hypothetical protein